MGMPGPSCAASRSSRAVTIHLGTGGPSTRRGECARSQVGDLRLQGGETSSRSGDLFEAPRRGRCPLADVHVTLGGRRSARLLRGLGANIVAVLPGEGMGLDTGG